MKMKDTMKRIIALILSVCLAVGMIPAVYGNPLTPEADIADYPTDTLIAPLSLFEEQEEQERDEAEGTAGNVEQDAETTEETAFPEADVPTPQVDDTPEPETAPAGGSGTVNVVLDPTGSAIESFLLITDDVISVTEGTVPEESGAWLKWSVKDFQGNTKAKSWANGSYSYENIDLSDCIYTFTGIDDTTRAGEIGFTVAGTAGASTVYLNMTGIGSNGQGYPNSSTPETVYFSNMTGSCIPVGAMNIKDYSSGFAGSLIYSKWNFFTSDYSGNDNSKKGAPFGGTSYMYLYEAKVAAESSGYHYTKVKNASELKENGKYIIVCELIENGQSRYMVLHPSTENSHDRRNAHTAQISDYPFFTAKTVTFVALEGAKNTDIADVTIGGVQYKVSISRSYVTTPKSNVHTLGVGKNKEKYLYDVPGYFTNENIVVESSTQNVAEVKIIKSHSNSESYANHHGGNGDGNGTSSGFRGDEIPLSDCLYTFTKAGDKWQIHSGDVYLTANFANLATGAGVPHSHTPDTFTISVDNTVGMDGLFNLRGANSKYLGFRRNNWGVFLTKSSVEDVSSAVGLTAQDCELLIFRPLKSGETEGYPDLPGYVRIKRVDELENNGKYLIGALYTDIRDNRYPDLELKPHYYFLYPCISGAQERTKHVVMANGLWTNGSSTLLFSGKNDGNTTFSFKAKTGSEPEAVGDTLGTYHVYVSDLPETANADSFKSKTGIANGCVINKLTISTGETYAIMPSFLEYAADDWYWVSSDDAVASVDENGVITANSTDGGLFGRVYVGVAKKNDTATRAIEVVVINTANNINPNIETRLVEFYTENMQETDVWYSWFERTENKERSERSYTPSYLRQIYEHEAMYVVLETTDGLGINFFAKAHEGYALTNMGATSSAANFLTITGSNAKDTKFFTENGAAGQNEIGIFGEDAVAAMVQDAMDNYGCSAAMGFSRNKNAGGSVASKISFISQRLPQLTKKVLGITRNGVENEIPDGYEDGIEVRKDDTVHFMINIRLWNSTKPSEETQIDPDIILYSNSQDSEYTELNNHPILKDLLPNATFSGYQFNPDYTVKLEAGGNRKVIKNDVSHRTVENPSNDLLDKDTSGNYIVDFTNESIDLDEVLKKYQSRWEFYAPQYAEEDTQQTNPIGYTLDLKFFVDYTVQGTENWYQTSSSFNGSCLENTAEFDYSFRSTFDTGRRNGAASAKAVLRVKVDNYLKYVNLSLDGSVGVNVYFKDDVTDLRYKHWKENCYVAIQLGGSVADTQRYISKTVRKMTGGGQTAILTVKDDSPDGTGTKREEYLRFSIPVAPQYMAEDIYVYIQDASGERLTDKMRLSVSEYAAAVLDASNESKLITEWQITGKQTYGSAVSNYQKLCDMLIAMLNYGAAVQDYLANGSTVAKYANSVLSEEQKNRPENPGIVIPDSERPAVNLNNHPQSAKFLGLSLVLRQGTTGIRVYFDPNGLDLSELMAQSQYIAQGASGTYYQFTFAQKIQQDSVGTYIQLNNISSHWLDNAYRVSIMHGNAESYVELTAMSYTYLLYKYGGEAGGDLKLKKMGAAMYLYNKAAETYFGTNTPGTAQTAV